MMLKVSELKKDLLTLRTIVKGKNITEQERDAVNNSIAIIKQILEDLEISGECIIEEI